MARHTSGAARRAIDAAVSAVPGSVVERVASLGAPLGRFSGRTRAGAAALAQALTVLTRPPHARARAETWSLDAIASEAGRPEDEIQAWADRGVLGAVPPDGAW
ncbi:MAG: hypothetical protein JOZ75_01700, partial [Candidatus Dormibacteraeota bacterium]|nr:hypothetical protein [Candidatus Dormibacteraeota bacterium]